MNSISMKETVDSLVSPLLERYQKLGLAIGFQKGADAIVYGYGRQSERQPSVPNARTIFEIGSVTKVFTATLLATMVRDGLVSFDDPLSFLLPECPDLPAEITLGRLATHTSGFPRLPTNLLDSPGFDMRNPYLHYKPEHLYAYLATYPGDQESNQVGTIAYSNLGMGVLGDVLARRLGMLYEQAIVQRICAPLGLPDTRTMLTAEQYERLATPHDSTGEPASNWDIPTMAGAGGLRSTAQDVLTFLAANWGDVSTPLKPSLDLCHEIVIKDFRPESKLLGVALGWLMSPLQGTDKILHWHNGRTGGYCTFAGFQKESQCGVVVLANHSLESDDIDRIGMTLLSRLVLD